MRVLVLMSALATMSLATPLAAQQPTSMDKEIKLTRDGDPAGTGRRS